MDAKDSGDVSFWSAKGLAKAFWWLAVLIVVAIGIGHAAHPRQLDFFTKYISDYASSGPCGFAIKIAMVMFGMLTAITGIQWIMVCCEGERTPGDVGRAKIPMGLRAVDWFGRVVECIGGGLLVLSVTLMPFVAVFSTKKISPYKERAWWQKPMDVIYNWLVPPYSDHDHKESWIHLLIISAAVAIISAALVMFACTRAKPRNLDWFKIHRNPGVIWIAGSALCGVCLANWTPLPGLFQRLGFVILLALLLWVEASLVGAPGWIRKPLGWIGLDVIPKDRQ